jgi:hypothetical protein
MEIPPPQYPSFPFIPLIPKQALIDQMYLPARISINNGFFPDQGGRDYEFIPTGITSIGGLELEI